MHIKFIHTYSYIILKTELVVIRMGLPTPPMESNSIKLSMLTERAYQTETPLYRVVSAITVQLETKEYAIDALLKSSSHGKMVLSI